MVETRYVWVRLGGLSLRLWVYLFHGTKLMFLQGYYTTFLKIPTVLIRVGLLAGTGGAMGRIVARFIIMSRALTIPSVRFGMRVLQKRWRGIE